MLDAILILSVWCVIGSLSLLMAGAAYLLLKETFIDILLIIIVFFVAAWGIMTFLQAAGYKCDFYECVKEDTK